MDNSDNTGTGEKADEIVFNYDGTAPVLENNDITIQNAVYVGEKDGLKRYVLKDGTSIRAELSDCAEVSDIPHPFCSGHRTAECSPNSFRI